MARWTPLSQLTQRGLAHAVRVLAGPPKIYEFDFPFNNGSEAFGEVRVAIDSGLLLKDEILPSLRRLATIVLLAIADFHGSRRSGQPRGPGAFGKNFRAIGPHIRWPI